MSHPVRTTDRSVSPAHVWVRLATRYRGQAIRLMAQLAFNLVTAESTAAHQESTHAGPMHPPKDST